MAFVSRLAGCVAAACLGACGGGSEGVSLSSRPPTAADAGAIADARLPPTLSGAIVRWLPPVPVGQDGSTAPQRIPVAGVENVSFWVKLSDDCGRRCCAQLSDVTVDGVPLVAPALVRSEHGQVCRDCASRVRVAAGDGLFTLPNDGSTLDGEVLEYRVQVRDCETYLPLEARFDDPLPAGATVGVIEHRAGSEAREVDLDLWFAEDALPPGDAWIQEATKVANRCFAASGLRFVASARRLPPMREVVYRPPHLDALSALVPDHQDRPTVVFAPCLVRVDAVTGVRQRPRGLSPRIPGGLAYDVLWISTETCSGAPPDSPQALGRLLAHELGHFYGLYHAVELDGSEDHLEDTDGASFMSALPTEAATCALTPTQAAVVRQHFSLD